MHTKVILFFFFCLITTQTYSQESTNYQFGIRTGFNSAHVSDKAFYTVNMTSVNYYHAGGYLKYNATKKWSILLEVLFSQKGGQKYISQTREDFFLKNAYLSFPLLLQHKLGNFILESGLEYSLKLSTKIDSDFPPGYLFTAESAWNKNIDAAFSFGFGYELYRFTIGLRKNIGLMNLIDIEVTNENGEVIQSTGIGRNQVLQLNIAYRL